MRMLSAECNAFLRRPDMLCGVATAFDGWRAFIDAVGLCVVLCIKMQHAHLLDG